MAISWPARIKDAGGIRHQFHHFIDIVPTILEATGIKAPEEVNGIKQNPMGIAKPILGTLVGQRSAAGLHALLDWRARNRTIRTENAARAWKRLQCLSATLTVVEGDARISRHGFHRLMAAVRASQNGLKLRLGHAANVAWARVSF